MICDIVRLASLLNDLTIARTVYDLVKKGYNPSTLYRYLDWLVDYGFIRTVKYDGVKYYHLTGLGAKLLKVLREAIVHRVMKMLEEKGVKYEVWWGDKGVRVARPIIYVDRNVSLPVGLEDLIELKVAGSAADQRER